MTSPQRLAACLAVVMVLEGCSAYRRAPGAINTSVSEQGSVKAGDNVRITLRTGERFETTVDRAQTDGIVVQKVGLVPYSEMAKLERRNSTGTRVGIVILKSRAGCGAVAISVAGPRQEWASSCCNA